MGAASEDEIRGYFNLNGQTTGKVKQKIIFFSQSLIIISFLFVPQAKIAKSELPGRPLELFMCSVLRRQGYGEGFRWIAQYI